ncbi:MAG: hypothetical protein NTY38_02565, partial [Acidobacteria bacterium]|nr:hypothetical protein [Acidobacteriota bacterium]
MTHRVSRRSFAGTTLGGMLAGGGTFARPDRTTPIQVGSSKQVFVGDDLIESSTGVRLTVNRPRKTGEQLIVSEHPWEEHRVGGANTILYDEGVYKLWYDCMSSDSRFQCYATSSDGLKWDKPSLGVVEYRGSRANNIVFQTATCSVFIDPRAPSEARYKALIQHKVRDVPLGYPWLLASPDGLRWRPFVERAVMEDRFFTDTPIVLFWDQRIGKYVTYGRAWDPVWPTGLRKVARAETDDVSRWPKPTIVLGRDAEDPENAHFYNPAAMQYPYAANLYLLFPSVYYPIQGDGPLDVQVALSRDGVRWLRPCRTPFLPIGVKGTYDAGAIYVTPGLIRHGDE